MNIFAPLVVKVMTKDFAKDDGHDESEVYTTNGFGLKPQPPAATDIAGRIECEMLMPTPHMKAMVLKVDVDLCIWVFTRYSG